METPSPQWVGREFVRQYYTIMHEAPKYLHRFYSHNSSFVHGGVEKAGEEQQPVMGQVDIHQKILSLNFVDCRAKIRQVDSQATVSNAVVVQVTGELSNDGQQMRRFMQTFVLAPQSPKKYYVHNDIFRYQDEVFHDSESDVENLEESGESEQEQTEAVSQAEPVPEPTVSQYYDQTSVLSNGNAEIEDRPESPAQKSVEEEPKEEPPEEAAPEPEKEAEIKTPEPEPVPDAPAEQKPLSWASLASKNAPPAQPSTTSAGPAGHAPPIGKPQVARPEVSKLDGNQGPQPQRTPRLPRERMRERERTSVSRTDDGDSDSLSGRRGSRYPDSHQLFVGNLPHNITERELRTYFETYGRVVELRINTKSGGGKLPNFGFVVFDSPDPVQHILSSKPIKYNGEHRLNVEEKKPRGAGSGPEGGRPMSGRGSRGGLGSSTGRGGIMGGNLGGSRGGIRPQSGGGSRPDNRLGGLSGGGTGGRGGPGAGGGGGARR